MIITKVHATDDYKLLIDFEGSNQISFNIQRMVETIPFFGLRDLKVFKNVKFVQSGLLVLSGWKGGNHAAAYYRGQHFIFSAVEDGFT